MFGVSVELVQGSVSRLAKVRKRFYEGLWLKVRCTALVGQESVNYGGTVLECVTSTVL